MSENQKGQNKLKPVQIVIIVITALIILAVAAFFIIRATQQEETPALQTIDTSDAAGEVTDAVAATEFQLALEDVVANVNGQPVTGADVLESYKSIVSYYGEPGEDSLELYYAVSMEQAITLKLIQMSAAEMGVDQFTQEELDALNATSDSEWQYALDNYVSSNLEDVTAATEDEKAAAYAEAETYYGQLGYTKETLRESYLENEVFERVKAELCKDVVVTDDEVTAYYNETVAADQATYENDVDAYETQIMMVQYGYADQTPWYHPQGYRYIQHILLTVDETLLATYTDLLARYEEQMDTEEEAAATAAPEATVAADATAAPDAAAVTPEPTQAPVTAEEIDAAKAAILASVQTTIDEINAKLAQGVSFEDLLTEYGTDPGMVSGSYPNGYEVSLASYGYVPEFVAAAFSVDAIGDISEPFISDYGVHIVKYVADVPAGPVVLTDELKEQIRTTLLETKNNEVLDAWHNAADIQYTGIVRSVEEIQAEEAETVTAE